MNLRNEFIVPDSFVTFRGSMMKNAITNETCRYSLSFGDKSIFDKASEELFKEFGAKSLEQEFKG